MLVSRWPLSRFSLNLLLIGFTCLFESCGGGNGSGGTTSTPTPISSPPSPSLTTSTTMTALDSSVPSTIAGLVSEVDSAADSKPLGMSLSIPSDSTGFSTPIFALDKNQQLLLAAMSGSQNTLLSATSTAEVLAILNLGISDAPTTSELTTTIDATPSFPALVTDIQAALSQGISPLHSQNVVKDLAFVLSDVAANLYQQETIKPFSVHPAISQSTETAAPPLPFQILGSSSSLKVLGAVYIDSLDASSDAVNLKNTLPIVFFASSGNGIASGKTLPAYDLFSVLVNRGTTSPQATSIAGSAQKFVLTIDTSMTDQQNLTQSLTDLIVFTIGKVTNAKPAQMTGLPSCAQKGAAQIVNSVVAANSQIFGVAATGADLSTALAATMTSSLVAGIAKSTLQCAAPELGLTVLTNLSKYLIPFLDVIVASIEAASAAAIVSELVATRYYWNESVAVNVCVANGQLTTCPITDPPPQTPVPSQITTQIVSNYNIGGCQDPRSNNGTSDSSSAMENIYAPLHLSDRYVEGSEFTPSYPSGFINSVFVLTNGVSGAAGAYPDQTQEFDSNGLHQKFVYSFGVTGSTLNESLTETDTAPLGGSTTGTQTNTYVQTSVYDIATGSQTYSFSLNILVTIASESNAPGCSGNETVNEQGSGVANYYGQTSSSN
jgi:hypothetical protein